MSNILNGKVAVVTGGSRGIGKAVSQKLASLGANIAVIYSGNDSAARNVGEYCEKNYGIKAKTYKCDVSNFTEVKETIAKIKTDFGTVHILINNAGITKDGLAAMMSEEDFDRVLEVNLKGAFNMIRHTAGLFIRNREGCVVNISSVAGLIGNAGQCNRKICREYVPKKYKGCDKQDQDSISDSRQARI